MATTFDTIQPLPVIDVPADLAVCCPEILGETISEEDAAVAARIFKALGDPGRVRLLSMIAAATDEGACVCDLVAPVGLSQPTVSHHLKVLL
ncbi:MAG: metalloregulator ArsR/SmtB family transcription factor, partial [Dehalococcoidia bacterium]